MAHETAAKKHWILEFANFPPRAGGAEVTKAKIKMANMLRSIVLGPNRSYGRISVTEASYLLGIGRVALSNLLNGNSGLSVDLAVKIERVFGHSARVLLQTQVEYQLDEYIQQEIIRAPSPRKDGGCRNG